MYCCIVGLWKQAPAASAERLHSRASGLRGFQGLQGLNIEGLGAGGTQSLPGPVTPNNVPSPSQRRGLVRCTVHSKAVWLLAHPLLCVLSRPIASLGNALSQCQVCKSSRFPTHPPTRFKCLSLHILHPNPCTSTAKMENPPSEHQPDFITSLPHPFTTWHTTSHHLLATHRFQTAKSLWKI
jgi:hypothetical protein